MPRISVVMPVKNGELFVEKSLRSILENIDLDDEVIVINDKSTDSTAEILDKFAVTDSRINVLQNIESGLVSALNFGVSQSKNPWIARFDVDDRYPKNRITEQRKLIADEVVAIFCDYEIFTPKEISLGVIPSAVNHDAILLSLVNGVRTPHPGAIFSKNAFLQAGGYIQNDFLAEDLSLWMRMSSLGKFTSVPKVLLYYRKSESSITGSNRLRTIDTKKRLVNDFISRGYTSFSLQKDFSKIVQSYSELDFAGIRIMLLYYDLFTYLIAIQNFRLAFKYLLSCIFSILKKPSLLESIFQILMHKIKRKLITQK
jgi:glycosyltransferase involved in cell wall biosynthesis